MSDELNNLDQSDETMNGSGAGGVGGADDLVGALADPDNAAIIIEEKKPLNKSTVVTFVVLVLGAGGMWFMYQRTGPSKAAAAASKETAAAKQTINNFLSGGNENIKVMETMLRSTQKVVQQFLNYPSMTQIPLSDLRTNPFRLQADNPADTGAASEAAEKKRREEERLAALKAVQGLQLQSIMYGESRRACMINGALYLEGQQVDGFSVEKINPASVVVKNGPYRFELRMQR